MGTNKKVFWVCLLMTFMVSWGFVCSTSADPGAITTLVGDGFQEGSLNAGRFSGDGNLATEASLYFPSAIFLDNSGSLYFSDTFNYRIRKVDNQGIVATVAGNGVRMFSDDGELAVQTTIGPPLGTLLDGAGNLYFIDHDNRRVRKVDAVSGRISTVAGDGIRENMRYYGDGVPAIFASLAGPSDLFVNRAGDLFIADTFASRILKIDAASGIITTVAGGGKNLEGEGAPATDVFLHSPKGIFIDHSGNLYITDRRHRLRKVDAASGIITTVAGDGFQDQQGNGRFAGDGNPATEASLNNPGDIFVDSADNVFIADTYNHRVRKIDATSGIITTVAGDGFEDQKTNYGRFLGEGTSATQASLNLPTNLFVDESGNLYISDSGNNRIRIVEGIAAPTVLSTGVFAPIEIPSADFNGDGTVDFSDFNQFAKNFGKKAGNPEFDPRFDLNPDGAIDLTDYVYFIRFFARSSL